MTPRRPPVAFVALAALLAAASVAAGGAYADDFSFNAESMSGSMVEGRERVVLKGKALVVSDGMRIEADRIELHGDDFRFAECTGRVRVVDEERGLRLTTETLFYDRRDKLSRLSGPSVMEDRKNRVVIKGDYIENDDQRKIALVQINVRILKDKLSCRAEFARYDREAKTLELSGSPTVRRDGDEYRAATILVNLDTEDIVLVGAVSGTVSAAGKKDAPAPAEGQPAAPAAPADPAVPPAPVEAVPPTLPPAEGGADQAGSE